MIGALLANAVEVDVVQAGPPLWYFFIISCIFGACVGSFLNVVVYRLPLEMSLVSPPSTCPNCSRQLKWYDNIPVFGWIKLGGKCRFCRNPISPQYPILEGFCALMFGAMFLAYYHTGDRAGFLQMPGSQTAVVFILHLFLLGGLIAASKIDANLFIIPLGIPWVVTVAAIIVVPIAGGFFPGLYRHQLLPRTPAWGICAAAGGTIGLIIAFALLYRGILPISFLDPAQVAAIEAEKKQKQKNDKADKKSNKKNKGGDSTASPKVAEDAKNAPPPPESAPLATAEEAKPASAKSKAVYLLILTAVAILLWIFSTPAADFVASPFRALAGSVDERTVFGSIVRAATSFIGDMIQNLGGRFAAFVLLWWGVLLVDFGAYGNPADLKDSGPEHWYVHPRPRFETLKEVLYLALPTLGAIIGIAIYLDLSPEAVRDLHRLPIWLRSLSGAVLGYLLGCAVVWFVRILGNLGFGKESMGLGDVHLVGCIGAVIGGNDAVVAFLLAAFFGLGYAIIQSTLGRLLVKRGVQIPYGPHLCGSAIALMLFRDPIEKTAVTWMGLSIFSW